MQKAGGAWGIADADVPACSRRLARVTGGNFAAGTPHTKRGKHASGPRQRRKARRPGREHETAEGVCLCAWV